MKLTRTNCPCVLTIYRKVLSKVPVIIEHNETFIKQHKNTILTQVEQLVEGFTSQIDKARNLESKPNRFNSIQNFLAAIFRN